MKILATVLVAIAISSPCFAEELLVEKLVRCASNLPDNVIKGAWTNSRGVTRQMDMQVVRVGATVTIKVKNNVTTTALSEAEFRATGNAFYLKNVGGAWNLNYDSATKALSGLAVASTGGQATLVFDLSRCPKG